jgi:hypothetical protein
LDLLFLFLPLAAASAQTKVMGVCEALNSAISSEEVIIHGTYNSWMEGAGFSEGLDGEPCPGWRKRFFTAPAFIDASRFSERMSLEQKQAYFEILKKQVSAHGAFTGPLAIKGVLIKKFWLFIFRGRDGVYWGNGFGPYGGYLAELVMTEPPILP